VKLKSSFAIGGWALATTAVLRRWLGTLDYKVDFSDPDVDPVSPAYRGAKIYVFWHENILIPLYLRGHSNISMLLSRHWDANILDRVARMMGFGVVRGSTFHGGSAALRELAERAAVGNLTITPDGPRGPRRRLAPGCVFLASTLGIPIVVMGLGYDRPKRVGTWDRFAIPRPFSRARGIVSRPTSTAMASSGIGPRSNDCSRISPTRPRRGRPPGVAARTSGRSARSRHGSRVELRC